jgi:very-short-patch-repair endonuclease
MTPAEEELWRVLRDRRFDGVKFRRRHPVGPFILDFCCPAARLAVEVDGDVHDEQRERDQARTAFLVDNGYSVLRFRNEEVLNDLDAVLTRIVQAVETGPYRNHRPI